MAEGSVPVPAAGGSSPVGAPGVQPCASVEVEIRVNGTRITRLVPVRMTLAQLLRDGLGLTGTKVSCEMQVCGACSVLVNGEPVSACTFLAADADGCGVETVEGLAATDGFSALQKAFIENSALQCGFCTPGFLMMATALLRENPCPSREEAAEYLEGNLCRCTGYQPIIEAVLQVTPDGGANERR